MEKRIKINGSYEDYYEEYPKIISEKNGIIVRKLIGKERNFFMAEIVFEKNTMMIGSAYTEKEIEEKIHMFQNSMQHLFLLENVDE